MGSNNQFIDLTGQIIGKWTVLYKSGRPRYWVCQCACGTVKEVDGHELRRGDTKSCGCTRNSMPKTGDTFGEWTVICKGTKARHLLCRCSCGIEKEVHQYSLTSGKSLSCGHSNTKYSDCNIGDKYNSLTLIRHIKNQIFEFKCECGSIKEYNINSVKSGNTKSCGCKRIASRYDTLINNVGDFKSHGIIREAWQINVLSSRDNFVEYLNGIDKNTSRIELADKLGVTRTALYEAAKRYDIELLDYIDARTRGKSPKETEVIDYIDSIYSGNIVRNTRSIIYPLELDIYIPEKKLAIEFNGDYWHSEEFKDRKYHQQKTIDCAKKGIRLIHIFEHEWDDENTQKKLKALIKGVLCGYTNIIPARKTTIQLIDSITASDFCNKYHIQGHVNSNIYIGCYYNNEIVGVMSFGKPRFNSDYQYELHRLCWKEDTEVIGGTEKLFKYFLNNFDVHSIITYSDISKFTGNIYVKLGFEVIDITQPDYIWFNTTDCSYISRYQAQKHKLIQLGIADEDDTEVTAMKRLKYTRVYDSGNIRLMYKT